MSKPADYTTPQLDAGWTHYANVYSAAPLMNDTAEDITGNASRAITITNPSSQIEWYTGSHGRGLRKTGSTSGNTIAYENLIPTGDTGTLILIYSVESSVDAGSYMFGGTNASLTTASSITLARWNLRNSTVNSNATGTGGADAARFVKTTGGTGERVLVLTWNGTRRALYQNSDGWIDGLGDPTDAYSGDFAPGGVASGTLIRLLSASTGESSVEGVVLTGVVALDTDLSQAQVKAIMAAPWDWVEDAGAVNTAPVFSGTIANISGTVGAAITSVDVSSLFSDADGDTLTFAEGGTWPTRDGGGSWVATATGIVSGTIDAGATTGAYTVSVIASDGTDDATSNAVTFTVNAAGDVPSITSVSGNVVHGQQFVITGTNLADATVTLDYSTVSVAQTIDSQTETEIVIATVDSSALPYRTLTLTVTEAGVGTDTLGVTHVAPAGYEYVIVDVPWADTSDSIFEGTTATAVVDGDMIEYEIESQLGAGVLVRGDGTLRVASETGRHLFDVRIWDESGLDWGASTEIIVTEQDYVPGSPTFDGPPIEDQVLEVGDAFSLDVTALFSDPDADLASYELLGDWPTWATEAAGVISGTAEKGTHTGLSVRAYDSGGLYGDSNTFSITVNRVAGMSIDKIAFSPATPRNVSEGSTAAYTLRFYSSGSLFAPDTVRYRVDDEKSGDEVLGWTTATAATSATIVLTASTNQMLDEGSRRERRRLTVEVDTGTDYAFSDSVSYDVVNQYGL